MKKTIQRSLSLALILIMLFSMVPFAGADGYGKMTVEELMKKFDPKVQRPKASSILENPIEMEVWSYYGNLVYVMSKPSNSSGVKLNEALEGAKVTVYAKESGFALAIVNNTRVGGWIKLSVLDTKPHEGHPSPLDLQKPLPDKMKVPVRPDYLDEYETMYVKSKYGVRICVVKKPNKSASGDNLLGYAYEREECLVLAASEGYLFVQTEGGEQGWVIARLLVYDYY